MSGCLFGVVYLNHGSLAKGVQYLRVSRLPAERGRMRRKVETNVGSDQQRVGGGAGNADRGGNAARERKARGERDKGKRETRSKTLVRQCERNANISMQNNNEKTG